MATWIRRRGSARGGFRYVTGSGAPVRAVRTLERIDALKVPPAWRDVHIAASARSAIQAFGWDARGRRQYRYHERSVERGERRKHYRVRRLARELPRIRGRLAEDFERDDWSREHVASVAVRLLSEGFFRVGSERYVKENRTFGLTTLRRRHVRVDGSTITFAFPGKGAKRQWRVIDDRSLARAMERLLKAKGARLFRYRSESGWANLTARDVNDYVRTITGQRYTAKDFRTWGGTLRFATVLAELGTADTARGRTHNVTMAVRLVAAELGNTPAICRKSYVHPILIARYLDAGETIGPIATRQRSSPTAHQPEERALIRFLDRHFPERRRRMREDERSAA
jgi:DNA topoisomerase-1